METGALKVSQVRSSVELDEIRRRFTADDPELDARFEEVIEALIRKIIQEAHDGIALPG